MQTGLSGAVKRAHWFAPVGRRYYDPISERMARGPLKNTSKFRISWIPDLVLTAMTIGPPGPFREALETAR